MMLSVDGNSGNRYMISAAMVITPVRARPTNEAMMRENNFLLAGMLPWFTIQMSCGRSILIARIRQNQKKIKKLFVRDGFVVL